MYLKIGFATILSLSTFATLPTLHAIEPFRLSTGALTLESTCSLFPAEPTPSITAAATNLVINPGFETGNFSGYTTTPATNTDFGVISGAAHTGNYGAYFQDGTVGAYDTISQSLNTSAATTFDVSFWLRNNGGASNGFKVTFGNMTLLNLVDSAAFGYTQYTFTGVAATGGATTIAFGGYQVPSDFSLDDISVTASAVPEPSTWLGGALIGMAACLGMRRRLNLAA